MPKYYCDYCDTYLTHDSPSVRKTHNGGRRHKDNVRLYYVNWLERQAQTMMTQPGGMPGGMRPMAPGLLTAPGMMPPVPPPGMVMPPPMGMPPGPPRPGVMVPPFPPHMAAVPPPAGSAPIPGSQPPRPTGSVPAMPPVMTSS